jgi:hypothetical protein
MAILQYLTPTTSADRSPGTAFAIRVLGKPANAAGSTLRAGVRLAAGFESNANSNEHILIKNKRPHIAGIRSIDHGCW